MRTDANVPSNSARESMHMTSSLQLRKKTKPQHPASSSTLIPKRNLSICGVCGQEDPPLPSDADDDEFESRITEWKRCAICKSPAHFSCSLNTKTCPCSRDSYYELYPRNYEEEIDSDELSD